MEKKWTPGPWKLSQETCYSGRMSGYYYRVFDDDFNAICSEKYGAHNDGGKENMNLIAAAPDLYEALEKLAMSVDVPSHLIGDIDAALAKARGEA